MKKLTLLVIIMWQYGNSAAQNKDLEIEAQITAVTVYNAAADVFCEKEVSLKKGRTTLTFTNLTPYIENNSIVLNTNSSKVEIISVTEKINYIKERKVDNVRMAALQDSVVRLKAEMGLNGVKKEAYSLEKKLLFKDESIGGVSKGVSVAEIEKASAFFSKRYIELSLALHELDVKEKTLAESLRKFELQLSQQAIPAQSISEISVVVNCDQDIKTNFEFKYLTPKAGWAPLYDCKFSGTQQPLTFIFRANVFNASGITWNNVELTLSTATPLKAFTAPTTQLGKDNSAVSGKVSGIDYKEVKVFNAITTYSIKNKSTIPSDSKPYLVDVNDYSLKAFFHYLVLPGMDPYGFLMSKIPDWNELNFMPGTMNVYNRGSYMGKTFLQTYTDNDTISIFLGKDNNIQTQRKEQNQLNKNVLIGNYYSDKSTISMTVKNTTGENVQIEVWDLVPIIREDEKLKMNLQQIESALHDKKQGLLIWRYELQPNEQKNVAYQYDIKIPKSDIDSYQPRKKVFRTISCPSF
jgi:hypothetical protein